MNRAVYYWAKLDKLMYTDRFEDNSSASALDVIAHKLDPMSKKNPRKLDTGISIIFISGNGDGQPDSNIWFSHDGMEELYYIGEL